MREKIFKVIEASDGNSLWSSLYDYFIMFVIVLSLVPLAFKETNPAFAIIDYVCAAIFIVDYLLRWMTADYKLGRKNVFSFLRYPFTFMALIDLISILPSLTILNAVFKLLRIFRLIRAFRVFRIFKAFRYSKSIRIIADVLKNSKRALASVGTFAIGYILVSALVVFNVEPESFDNFFEAIYWATVSLTTVGYGDIYPVSVAGQIITMFSSLFGIAIIALPSGVITAGYMKAIDAQQVETDTPKLRRRNPRLQTEIAWNAIKRTGTSIQTTAEQGARTFLALCATRLLPQLPPPSSPFHDRMSEREVPNGTSRSFINFRG